MCGPLRDEIDAIVTMAAGVVLTLGGRPLGPELTLLALGMVLNRS